MKINKKEKYIGAMIVAAVGDALGWPNENNSHNLVKHTKIFKSFIGWKRKSGGRYWPYQEDIKPGEYSDDTQLLLATLRSLLKGNQWGMYFIKTELPAWLSYERGGGGATKRAAKQWLREISPWDEKNDKKSIMKYYMAGGNGATMRIMPHVFLNENNDEIMMKQVMVNSMSTHGHPRALIGAMLYACAIHFILMIEGTLKYGQLIEHLIDSVEVWGKLPKVENIEQWKKNAKNCMQMDYDLVWEKCVQETLDYLNIAYQGIDRGILDVGNETLEQLGCFDKKINGAGNITSVISIFLFSKYADNPSSGLLEAVNLEKADTDTIASLLGGLFGGLYGINWLPIELRTVQDYRTFEILVTKLIEKKDDITYNSKDYKLFTKENVCLLQVGETIEVLPFGKIELLDIRTEAVYSKDMYAYLYVFKTEYEQTIYVSKVGKKTLVNSVSLKNKIENIPQLEKTKEGVWLNKDKMIMLGNIFKNVEKTEEFIQIIYELLSLFEKNISISKTDLKTIKERWKKYKITLKQLNEACRIIK